MKKGLLSILAGALLVVGCQNYDDQFDQLESQINALSSTVAGLSQVQSDLASLAGTVSSLQSTVNGLGDTIDTAVADGLSDIQTDIDEIEAAVAGVATSQEVADLQAAVDASQEDLDELLSSSNYYTTDLTVSDNETLAFAKTLGAKLAVVNGNVTITATKDMANADLQAVLDNLGTVVGTFKYSVSGATVEAVNFDMIKGTQNIDVDQPGNYSFASLTSAKDIKLGTTYASKVGVVNLEKLTTVGTLVTGTTSHTVSFAEATNIHLTALPYYTAASALTLKGATGSTILIDNLASVDADGLESTLDLTVEGAQSLNFSKITDGDISATKVDEVTGGADHDGTITLNDVRKAVIPNFTRGLTLSSTSDLEYLHVIGAAPKVATGATAVTVTPALDVTGQTRLKTLIVDGVLDNVTISGNTNLTDVTFTATAEAVTVTGASDLTSLSLAGSAKSIDVNNNADLANLTITSTLTAGKVNGTAVTGGALDVDNNAALTKLTSSYDPVKHLDVHTNAKLAVLDFAGTETVGATTDKAFVNISGNALNASKVVDTYAEADTATSDLTGTVSDESGISTLKTYLTAAVAAAGKTGVKLSLDTVDLWQVNASSGAPTEYTDIKSGHAQEALLVLVEVLTPDSVAAVKPKIAISYQPGNKVDLDHIYGGVTTQMVPEVDLNANATLAAAQILDASNGYVANAAAVGITLNAYVGGGSSVDITILANNSSATNEASNAGAGAGSSTFITGADDVVGLTVDGLTVTAVFGAGASDTNGIASRIASIWNTKYDSTATETAFTADADTVSGTITVTADESAGSRFDGKSVALVVDTGTDTTTIPVIGYKIGALRASSDNKTVSGNVIITLEAKGTTSDEYAIQTSVATQTSNDVGLLLTSGTSTTTSVQRGVALSDAVAAVAGIDGATSADAKSTNFLSWIGS